MFDSKKHNYYYLMVDSFFLYFFVIHFLATFCNYIFTIYILFIQIFNTYVLIFSTFIVKRLNNKLYCILVDWSFFL